jgi:hypothetical protein
MILLWRCHQLVSTATLGTLKITIATGAQYPVRGRIWSSKITSKMLNNLATEGDGETEMSYHSQLPRLERA